MSNQKIVGKQIKKARNEQSISQLELSKKVGVSRMMISRYEIGSSNIPLKQLQKISAILKKPISYFFGEEPQQDSGKIWKEAQKYLELLKDKVGGDVSLSPHEMLAFSLGDPGKTKEAIDEARVLMKNWYMAHDMENITNKTFQEWWEDKIM